MDQADVSQKHVDSVFLKQTLFSMEKRELLSSIWILSVPSTCTGHLESFK